jgi:hypothetical protein
MYFLFGAYGDNGDNVCAQVTDNCFFKLCIPFCVLTGNGYLLAALHRVISGVFVYFRS